MRAATQPTKSDHTKLQRNAVPSSTQSRHTTAGTELLFRRTQALISHQRAGIICTCSNVAEHKSQRNVQYVLMWNNLYPAAIWPILFVCFRVGLASNVISVHIFTHAVSSKAFPVHISHDFQTLALLSLWLDLQTFVVLSSKNFSQITGAGKSNMSQCLLSQYSIELLSTNGGKFFPAVSNISKSVVIYFLLFWNCTQSKIWDVKVFARNFPASWQSNLTANTSDWSLRSSFLWLKSGKKTIT